MTPHAHMGGGVPVWIHALYGKIGMLESQKSIYNYVVSV